MVDWKSLKKIDAHIHILPDAVHEANPDSEDVWVYADLHKYRSMMDKLGIEKAVIMPLNDPWLMSMEFTVDAVHRNLYEIKKQYPGKFYAFADVDTQIPRLNLWKLSARPLRNTDLTVSRFIPITPE